MARLVCILEAVAAHYLDLSWLATVVNGTRAQVVANFEGPQVGVAVVSTVRPLIVHVCFGYPLAVEVESEVELVLWVSPQVADCEN